MRTELAESGSLIGSARETLDENSVPPFHPLVLAQSSDLNMVIFENIVPLRMSPTLELHRIVRSDKVDAPTRDGGRGPSSNGRGQSRRNDKPGDAA